MPAFTHCIAFGLELMAGDRVWDLLERRSVGSSERGGNRSYFFGNVLGKDQYY